MESVILLYIVISYPIIIGYVTTLIINSSKFSKDSKIGFLFMVLISPVSLLFILGGLLCKISKE